MPIKINNVRGAFLLEALLAVFILSVALTALIRGLLSSMNAAAKAEEYSDAIIAADNALIEVVRLNGQEKGPSVELEKSIENMIVEVAVQKPGQGQFPDILNEARLRTAWPGEGKKKDIEAVTLIFGPANEKK